MNQHFLPGNPPLEINLRPSKQAKRMSLRVSRLDGRVTLTFPYLVGESQALEFAREKEHWLRAQRDQHEDPIQVGLGVSVPYQGRQRVITQCDVSRIEIDDDIRVPRSKNAVSKRLLAHLKQSARSELAFASDKYSKVLGRPYSRLSIRDTRSRWGSCSSSGGLMYSWRLIMAPPEVLDYVAAHEVAHLAEMNHSQAFWDTVKKLYGDYTASRNWLRDEGHALHRYRFED